MKYSFVSLQQLHKLLTVIKNNPNPPVQLFYKSANIHHSSDTLQIEVEMLH